MEELIKQPKTKFLKVKCKKCKNEQVIFGNPSTVVNCLVCSAELAKPSGGKAKNINAHVLEVIE